MGFNVSISTRTVNALSHPLADKVEFDQRDRMDWRQIVKAAALVVICAAGFPPVHARACSFPPPTYAAVETEQLFAAALIGQATYIDIAIVIDGRPIRAPDLWDEYDVWVNRESDPRVLDPKFRAILRSHRNDVFASQTRLRVIERLKGDSSPEFVIVTGPIMPLSSIFGFEEREIRTAERPDPDGRPVPASPYGALWPTESLKGYVAHAYLNATIGCSGLLSPTVRGRPYLVFRRADGRLMETAAIYPGADEVPVLAYEPLSLRGESHWLSSVRIALRAGR